MVHGSKTKASRPYFFIVALSWNSQLGAYLYEVRGREIPSPVRTHIKLMIALELLAVGDTAIFVKENEVVRIVGRPGRWGEVTIGTAKQFFVYPVNLL